MEDDSLGDDINPWGVAMFGTVQDVELSTPNEEAAYGKWLDQTSTREEGRLDRIHGVAGLMPTPLWIGLFFMSAIVLTLIFGFADSGERAWVQALFMGSVVAVVVTMLLLLAFLDDPFHSGVGGLQPVAMERTELLIDQQLDVLGARHHDPVRRRRDRGVTTSSNASPARRDWVEIVATVLLAFAAVATAWSSYQATRWNGENTKASGRANALRIEAARSQGLAEGQTQVDIGMFFQWVNANAADDIELAEFYDDAVPPRVPPRLRRLGGHRSAHQPGRAAHAVRDGRVPAAGRHRRRATRRRGRDDRRVRSPQRRACRQLRARRRAVRRRPLLRRDEHQAERRARRARCCSPSAASCSSAPPSGSPRSRSASTSSSDRAQASAGVDGFGSRRHVELAVDALDMRLEGVRRHVQRRRDLPVGEPAAEVPQHRQFA